MIEEESGLGGGLLLKGHGCELEGVWGSGVRLDVNGCDLAAGEEMRSVSRCCGLGGLGYGRKGMKRKKR